MTYKTILRTLAFSATMALAGCIGGPAPSQTLLVLPTSLPPGSRPTPGVMDGKILGVGPVEVAPHLDRSYVPVRLEETRYEYADSLRWASPARKLLADRLREVLIWITEPEDVRVFPWPSERAPDVGCSVRFLQFELTRGGTAEILAQWVVKDGLSGHTVGSGTFSHVEPIHGSSGAAGVEALDRALIRFAEALARELK